MALRIISRDDAKASGLKRFFTGEPCTKGHTVERYVSSGNCVTCAAARFDDWYAKTRNDKHAVARRLKEARTKAAAEGLDTFVAETPCKNGHIGERWVRNGLCVTCSRSRALRWFRRHGKSRYTLDAPRRLAANQEWRKRNKPIVRQLKRVSEHRRRSRKGEKHYTRHQIDELFDKQNGRCAACLASIKKQYEIDHVIPLVLGGSNVIENIQLLCPKCNRSKGGKHPFVWANKHGRLL